MSLLMTLSVNISNQNSNRLSYVKNNSCAWKVTRRRILTTIGTLPLILYPSKKGECKIRPGDWSSPGLSPETDDSAPKFVKNADGIKIQELEQGKGKSAVLGDVVVVDYVLRRSNGYFIYSTVEGVSFQPRDVPVGPLTLQLGDPSFISGFTKGLVGMKSGGRRRVVVPAELGYKDMPGLSPQPPNFAGKRQIVNHANEELLFEIELVKIRKPST